MSAIVCLVFVYKCATSMPCERGACTDEVSPSGGCDKGLPSVVPGVDTPPDDLE